MLLYMCMYIYISYRDTLDLNKCSTNDQKKIMSCASYLKVLIYTDVFDDMIQCLSVNSLI